MSAKQLGQASLATKTAFLSRSRLAEAGMLAELAEQFSGVQATFAEASEAVGFDLWHIAQSGEGLDQTEFTQPVPLTARYCAMARMAGIGRRGAEMHGWPFSGRIQRIGGCRSDEPGRCGKAGAPARQADAERSASGAGRDGGDSRLGRRQSIGVVRTGQYAGARLG